MLPLVLAPARTGRAFMRKSLPRSSLSSRPGRLPWVQPLGSSSVSAPLTTPKDAATGRGYLGINVLILWGAVVQHGFPTQSWLTFRQALDLGGNVRKGERGTTVVYADRFVPDDERRRSRETGDEAVAIPFLKRFTVFNAARNATACPTISSLSRHRSRKG